MFPSWIYFSEIFLVIKLILIDHLWSTKQMLSPLHGKSHPVAILSVLKPPQVVPLLVWNPRAAEVWYKDSNPVWPQNLSSLPCCYKEKKKKENIFSVKFWLASAPKKWCVFKSAGCLCSRGSGRLWWRAMGRVAGKGQDLRKREAPLILLCKTLEILLKYRYTVHHAQRRERNKWVICVRSMKTCF